MPAPFAFQGYGCLALRPPTGAAGFNRALLAPTSSLERVPGLW